MTDQHPMDSELPSNQTASKTTESDADHEEISPERVSALRNAFGCIVVVAAAAFIYSFQFESSLFRAIALQLCLSGLAIWSTMDAVKLRRKLRSVDNEDVLALRREASAIHYLFIAAPLMAILVFTGLSIIGQLVEVAIPRSQQQVIGGAILALLAASLWTVFARTFQQPPEASREPKASGEPEALREQGILSLPEGAAVRAALLESRLAALLAGGALMGATVFPSIEGWFAWVLCLWTFAVAMEFVVRLLLAWFQPVDQQVAFKSPVDSLLREIFLSSANPVANAFDIAEARFGLSLRSSWTLGFFRRSVVPIAVGCLLVVWLSTCFVVIEPHQAGLEERFGVAQRVKLSPGLHTKLPSPFGEIHRYPAGIVQTMQIGFEEDNTAIDVSGDVDRTLLWTQPHAKEFSLVLGSETELVAINAIIYFKIAEDTEGFLDHALATSNPEVALESLAYRVLMEQTRSATLEDLLSQGRDEFSETVRKALSEYSSAERLGLDVVNVSLINLHPPVEVASSYLDVINAELDGDRVTTVADGQAAEEILVAEQESIGRIAVAKIDAAKRVSIAGQESAEFMAVGEAFKESPQTYQLRLWFEAFEQVLFGRRLFIVDSELPDVIFDERSRSIDSALIETTQPSGNTP